MQHREIFGGDGIRGAPAYEAMSESRVAKWRLLTPQEREVEYADIVCRRHVGVRMVEEEPPLGGQGIDMNNQTVS